MSDDDSVIHALEGLAGNPVGTTVTTTITEANNGDNGGPGSVLGSDLDNDEAEGGTGVGSITSDRSESTGASWTYPINKSYQHYIVSFMKFKYKQPFAKDHQFSKQQLLDITPKDVRRWLLYRAYKTTKQPGPNERPRVFQRAGTLEKAKSGLSY